MNEAADEIATGAQVLTHDTNDFIDSFHALKSSRATNFLLTRFWYVVTSKLKVLAKQDRLEGWAESRVG